MISSELLKKIRRIEITTNRIVNSVVGGQYQSAFKGRGMEFSEVREYTPGDDIRTIDWNVTARFGKPFVKRFIEERELTVMLLNDISGSQYFGTRDYLKSELAAEVSAILAFSAIKNNDQVGSILFSDRIQSYIPPKKGSTHVLRVIRDLLFQKASGLTNINHALEYFSRVQKKRSVVFLVSDFLDDGYEKNLRIAHRHHDFVAVVIEDPSEIEMPAMGWLTVEDAETGEIMHINLRKKSVRDRIRETVEEKRQKRDALFRSAGIDVLYIKTDKPYHRDLYRFFKRRAERMK